MHTQQGMLVAKMQLFKEFSKFACLLGICYLQSEWPLEGIPTALMMFLWTVYVIEIAILSLRMFNIKTAHIKDILKIFKSLL